MGFELEGFDHIHIHVSNRIESEKWYKSVLGLYRTKGLELWTKDNGPLMLQNQTGSIHLALFESRPIQNTIVAFKTSATELLVCIKYLSSKAIEVEPIDHDISWSIYFQDPDGNPYEITTNEYELFSKVFKKNI